MADKLWPGSLPQDVLYDGYGETVQTPKYSVPTDNSMPIDRPKTTLRSSKLQVSMDMTRAQLQTFEDFCFNDLGQTTSPFYMNDPRLRRQVRVQMVGDEPYQISPMGPTYFKVSMILVVFR